MVAYVRLVQLEHHLGNTFLRLKSAGELLAFGSCYVPELRTLTGPLVFEWHHP